MKRLLLIIALLNGISHAVVNECKSDVYFANGIDTSKKAANESARQLSKKFKLYNPESYKSVAKWKVNYNHTHSICIDLYESMLQKINELVI